MNYCIAWPGYLDKDGYCQINSNKLGTLRAARIVLEEKLNRNIRNGHQAHHVCYTRDCISPYHIEERSMRDNIMDRYFNDRPENDKIELTKKDVYLVFYLLTKNIALKKISNLIKVSIHSSTNKAIIDIPIEVILFIRDFSVWSYIHLFNWEKVEALLVLDTFFPYEKCIEPDWGGNNHNYSVVQKDKIQIPAHIFFYRLHNKRPIPEGQLVRHMCDNKRCIRPQHLALGSINDG
ncbi:HNH endonuclease [Cytobacillus sp. Hm23]